MTSPQTSTLLTHLRTYGSITTHEAFISHSIVSLTRRIRDLREDGHNIISETRKHRVTKKRYVRYHLIETAQRRAVAA